MDIYFLLCFKVKGDGNNYKGLREDIILRIEWIMDFYIFINSFEILLKFGSIY